MDYISFERLLFNECIKVKTSKDIIFKTILYTIFIEDLQHAIIIFPDGSIFNCNPRDYPIKSVLKQIEPFIREYEHYWNSIKDPFIENDQNCLLWRAYYLDWVLNRNSKNFSPTLVDLEKWCKTNLNKLSIPLLATNIIFNKK